MYDAISIKSLVQDHWDDISRIYKEGIETGIATFETEVPDWPQWNDKYIRSCRFVAEFEDQVVGFAVLSQVSKREVYKGVAEVSIYIDTNWQGKGVGRLLLDRLIKESESEGYWTLTAGIFPENYASIALHKKCGFRIIGTKEKIAQLDGKWYDNCLMERRSKKIV